MLSSPVYSVSIYRIIWLQSESHHHGNVFGGSKSPHYLKAASASYHSTQPEVEKESGEEMEEGRMRRRRGVEGGEGRRMNLEQLGFYRRKDS